MVKNAKVSNADIASSFTSITHGGDDLKGVVALNNEKRDMTKELDLSFELDTRKPQLTIKAIAGGCAMGVVCSFLALYYGLKTGVVPSLNILSGLGGFILVSTIVKLARKCGFFWSFTPQENAVVQTVAVATYSASSPGFGFSSGYLAMTYKSCKAVDSPADDCYDPAQMVHRNIGIDIIWSIALAFFGFFIAFPLRKYAILQQRLTFPSGTATSFVIKAMHASVEKAQVSFSVLAKFFCLAYLTNMVTWCWAGLSNFPVFGPGAALYGWHLDWDLGTIGISFIMGNKINFSLGAGAVIGHAIMRPILDHTVGNQGADGWYDKENPLTPQLDSKAYTLFAGLAVMIVQGAYSIIQLFWVLLSTSEWGKKMLGKKAVESVDGVEPVTDAAKRRDEVLDEIFVSSKIPLWLGPVGYLLFGALCIIVMQFLFRTPWYQVLVALLIIPIFAVANAQGIGRTDWDVSSSYGKLIMFPFGLWNKGKSIIPSLVLCIVTISGCSNAGTLLQDFKTGYLLGTTPMIMFIAQAFGQLFGCLVTPLLWALLDSAFELPTNDESAFISGLYGKIYRVLAIVATSGGFDSLPKNTLWVALGFIIFAILLDLAHIFLPEKIHRWIPEPTALAIGLLISSGTSLNFIIGACIRTFWLHHRPSAADVIPYLAAGLVAGSGIAVVTQCLASLASVSSPMVVTFNQAPLSTTWYTYLIGFVVILVVLAVFACGGFYWFPAEEDSANDDSADEKNADPESPGDGETCPGSPSVGGSPSEVHEGIELSERSDSRKPSSDRTEIPL